MVKYGVYRVWKHDMELIGIVENLEEAEKFRSYIDSMETEIAEAMGRHNYEEQHANTTYEIMEI